MRGAYNRDGMKKLYLDSRDLIDLVSHDAPVSPAELGRLLEAEHWALVYSFANICEVVVVDDLLETRRRLQVLDRLPHTHIVAPPILRCKEFREAVDAFETGGSAQPIDPFVAHWHQTYVYPGQPNRQNMLVNYPLADQVLPLAICNPDVCRNLPQHASLFQHAVNEDRMVTDAVRRSRERFEGGVKVALVDCGLSVPSTRLTNFAKWIRDDPTRCPGWRIFTEAYLQFCGNVGDQVERGDIPDFSHIACLPYVDAITLDRRMAEYCRTAALKFREQDPSLTYADRVFKNAEAWLQSI